MKMSFPNLRGLRLYRACGEEFTIEFEGMKATITVVETSNSFCRLAIHAPDEVKISRSETAHLAKDKENDL